MLLALLATALMAVVIFAPSRAPAAVATSFAPPAAPPAIERCEAIAAREPWESSATIERCEPISPEPPSANAPAWPALIDRRASGCDAAARLGLVEALASVRTAWSQEVLRRALDDENDPTVRAAVVMALGAAVRYPAALAYVATSSPDAST
ncbi:MAG TPA: HEAT repeat domain-containing protein [Xanthomonadales bacterium]|nr:HEAT repeat domain-containing protein [Xanthomonadales bacterium]